MREEFQRQYAEIQDRHWWFRGRRAIILRILERHLDPQVGDPPRTILDIGCGTGAMLPYLAAFGAARGIESDTGAVRLAQERSLPVELASPPPLRVAEESLDLITAFDVFEHVDDDSTLAHDCRRALRPGGTLMLTVPAYEFLWGVQDEVSDHRRRYVASGMRELVRRAGFEVRRITYFNTLLFPAVAAVRVGSRIWPRSPKRGSDFELTPPGRANELLARVLASEARLLDRITLPFGVSILALAVKPAGG